MTHFLASLPTVSPIFVEGLGKRFDLRVEVVERSLRDGVIGQPGELSGRLDV